MELAKALRVLEDNAGVEEGSFLWLLHERDTFGKKELETLTEAIDALAQSDGKNLETGGKITEVYSEILLHLIYHFNPNDLCSIKRVNRDIYEDLEPLRLAVNAYFRG